MAAAIFARDVLRLPIRIVFTSAAQRLHSVVPRHLIAKMDAVVATTTKAASLVPKLAGVVPHGVDTTRFTPTENRSSSWASLGYGGHHGIGIVGRVRPEKGTDLFVDAMIRVLPDRPDFTAIIIGRTMPGDAAFEADLRSRIQSAGLSDRILFVGEHPPHEMPKIIQSLSLLVAPARYEGYGMTPLEAMASGVPVVASDTGVYGEIIQSQVGHVVPIGNLDDLTMALMDITQSTLRLARMGQAARQTAEDKLTLQHEAAGYASLLRKIWQGETFSQN
jgi:mannosyltransferase